MTHSFPTRRSSDLHGRQDRSRPVEGLPALPRRQRDGAYRSKSFRDADFEFRGRVLRGETTQPPRDQLVLDAINLAAGPMLAREYVSRYLDRKSTRLNSRH